VFFQISPNTNPQTKQPQLKQKNIKTKKECGKIRLFVSQSINWLEF